MSPSDLQTTLQEAIDRHDRVGAVRVALDVLEDGSATPDELYGVLSEIMVGVGSAWQEGTTEVWEEHLASSIVRTVVESATLVVDRLAPAERTATVVLAAPDDEYHDLGLRMLADRFALAGWKSHLLGAAVPVEQAVAAVAALGADAIVVSASTHFHRLSLRGYVAHLVEAHPTLRIWVGGAAFKHEQLGWPETMVLAADRVPPPGQR